MNGHRSFAFTHKLAVDFMPPVGINEGFRPFETQSFLRNMFFCV